MVSHFPNVVLQFAQLFFIEEKKVIFVDEDID